MPLYGKPTAYTATIFGNTSLYVDDTPTFVYLKKNFLERLMMQNQTKNFGTHTENLHINPNCSN